MLPCCHCHTLVSALHGINLVDILIVKNVYYIIYGPRGKYLNYNNLT
jgi:hypothetical protein